MSEPSLEQAWNELRGGNNDAALSNFRSVLRKQPGNADALYGIALVAMRTGNYEAAVPIFEQAISGDPNNAGYRADYSYCLRRIGRQADAANALTSALDIEPNNSQLWCASGELMISRGETEIALKHLHKSISLDSINVDAYSQLSLLVRDGHYAFSQPELQVMNSLVVDSALPDRARALLLFALAYHFDSTNEPDQAFEKFKLANDLRLSSASINERFDVTSHDQFVEELRDVFTPDFVARHPDGASKSELPIFIVGMMRSGTSLVEQIISSHPEATAAGELSHIYSISTQGLAMLTGGKAYPQALQGVRPAALTSMASDYLTLLQQRDPIAKRVTDKMPTNFQFLGLIWMLFPNARVIHIARDPMDTCVSCYCNNLQAGWTCDLEGLGHFYNNYRRIMELWTSVLPLKMLNIQYEDLVAQSESGIREIIEFCGLEWHDDCLNFHESKSGVHTASKLQVRKAVHGERVARWKRYEKHLAPLVKVLRNSE